MHPLTGIRVIECGVAIAGPMAARILGHLGAEIIKIDTRANSISAGAPAWAPKDIGKAGADLAPGSHLNGGKLSVALDLKSPQVRPAFERLAAASDVFLSNLSVPAIESLNLTYDVLRKLNPRLVYIAMPGFGFGPGPYRDYRSWGPNLSSLSGLDYLTGDADRGPVMTPLPLPDYVGAYHAVTAVQAALLRRDATGEGCEIAMSQFETTINVLGPQALEAQLTGIVPGRQGNRVAFAAPRDLFPCKGHDRWVAIEIFDDDDWRRLIALDGMPVALRRPEFAMHDARLQREAEIYPLVAEWTRVRTDREAAAELQAAGIAGNPVQNSWDHVTDYQLEARGYWKLVAHDRLGLDLTSSLPAQFAETPARYSHAMPSFGHDTEQVLGDVAGLGQAEIQQLLDGGVAEGAAPLPDHLEDTILERPSRTWAWPLLRLKPQDVVAPPPAEPLPSNPLAPKPLDAVTVLDLSDSLSAYGTYLLARLGMHVIRVESPTGHALRTQRPVAGGLSPYEQFMDGGKSSIVADLETAEGREMFRELASTADAIYDSSGLGNLARHGFDWETLHALNPSLSLVSVNPFGETGPYHARRAGELGLWAMSSMLPITGYPDRRPMLPGGALAANLVGATGAYSLLAALNARNRTGKGQRVDVSAHEVLVFTCSGMINQVEDGAERQRSGVRALGAAPYGFFQCADRQVSLLALFPNHWSALSNWIVEKTGNRVPLEERFIGTSQVRYRYHAEIEELINSLAGQYEAGDFCREAQARGVPAMPVNSVAELLVDPHLEGADYWDDVQLANGQAVRWPGPPFRMPGMPPARRAPGIGEALRVAVPV